MNISTCEHENFSSASVSSVAVRHFIHLKNFHNFPFSVLNEARFSHLFVASVKGINNNFPDCGRDTEGLCALISASNWSWKVVDDLNIKSLSTEIACKALAFRQTLDLRKLCKFIGIIVVKVTIDLINPNIQTNNSDASESTRLLPVIHVDW